MCLSDRFEKEAEERRDEFHMAGVTATDPDAVAFERIRQRCLSRRDDSGL